MTPVPGKGSSLALASYNIHRCFGTDRKYLPERIAEVIQALACDVVALQEVDMRLLVDGRPQLEFLADTLNMTAVAGASIEDHRGHFGNALLSRLPVQAIRRIDLSVRQFEPRGAIDADLDGVKLRMVATHLGLNGAERRLQVRRLLQALHPPAADRICVILGDFNEWRPVGGSLRELERRFTGSTPLRSFPSRFPLFPLDRMWVWPLSVAFSLRVYAAPLARLASDHLPIRAEMACDDRRLSQKTGIAPIGPNTCDLEVQA
ncbi:MAG TPA: hypothetical protein HPQ04_05090 [Rhodospirillaceae bacterium]|nr:hypothetical protein [Rhodospirillaceae bacterium]